MQTRNKYSMRIFSESFYFFIPPQFFNCLPTQYPHGQGEAVVKQKVDRTGQEKGGRLNTGKNVRATFMADHL